MVNISNLATQHYYIFRRPVAKCAEINYPSRPIITITSVGCVRTTSEDRHVVMCIGCSESECEGKYTNWFDQAPNHEYRRCVYIGDSSGRWDVSDCGARKHYICEYRKMLFSLLWICTAYKVLMTGSNYTVILIKKCHSTVCPEKETNFSNVRAIFMKFGTWFPE